MASNDLNTMEPLVTGTGIGVRHGNQTILDDVDISVHRSEIVTLIGPNGSGKTTLVRSLLGLQKPKFGSVSSPVWHWIFPIACHRSHAPVERSPISRNGGNT